MKIFVAAAGKGTRMKELTLNKPKHLIEIKGRSFLHYLLENIKKAGYKEIYVIGGYKIDEMKEFISDYDHKIVLINQHEIIKDGSYGTIPPVKSIKHLVKEENFIFVAGDNLYSEKDLRNFNTLEDNYCYVGGFIHEHPEHYGVLKTDGDFLDSIHEKPKEKIGNLINTGLYKFTKDIFPAIDQVKISQRGEYELTDAINNLAKEKKVKVANLEDYWYDFGKPEDIKIIENFLNK
ncbi:MAG: sugar phosphate nucleotidyltransferase [Patescibacteria group bacterium]|jgi:bifunctional UDP-N-acetylglucosamine pyrophosphorylase/glucosamine-1-phosphate N-acetyltransferase